MTKSASSPAKKPLCARCRKHPAIPEYRPFCSKRCADADLGQWLTGSYVIPGASAEQADDAVDFRRTEDDTES